MQRRKPLGHLRAKQREGGHPAKRGQVARPGIVADERARAIRQRQQLRNRPRRGHVLFPGRQPPIPLVRIAGDLHAIILLAQPGDQAAIPFQRPDAHGLARAGMHQDFTVGTRVRQRERFARRQVEAQGPAP